MVTRTIKGPTWQALASNGMVVGGVLQVLRIINESLTVVGHERLVVINGWWCAAGIANH